MRMVVLMLAVCASGQGVAPRASASSYPVSQNTATATLAAALVPSGQVANLFSSEIARRYVVVEVAAYPEAGARCDIDWFDFRLKTGEVLAHVEKPRQVVTAWREKTKLPSPPVSVSTEAGVGRTSTTDPVNGRRSGWGTYESVGVDHDPGDPRPPAPPRNDPDPQVLEQRIAEKMIPEGPTRTAVAGYLFFPKTKRQKGASMELQWSRANESAVLRLAEK